MKTTIKAELVAHSKNQQGDELISILATFPRIILAEVNTHRMLSKNTSSSRAIPFSKMVESVQNDPFIPIAWQKEHKGMQGTEYFTEAEDIKSAEGEWLKARDNAVIQARHLSTSVGVTKQLCNRLLEPFMWTTMLITGSKEGWDNFFKLRCPDYIDKGIAVKSKKELINLFPELSEESDQYWRDINTGQAEIHIMDLAEKIYDTVNESTPKVLKPGEWHIPFGDVIADIRHWGTEVPQTMEMVKVSVAMAARTSYTVVGEEKVIDYEAMIGLHDRLLAQDPPHSSPMEHTCICVSQKEYDNSFKGQEKGWFRNYKGFKSYRQIIEDLK